MTGEVYHVYTRSIAGFRIFHYPDHYRRFENLMRYYRFENPSGPYAFFCRSSATLRQGLEASLKKMEALCPKRIEIIAYCLMPTHVHIALKQLAPDGISFFMAALLDSYSRFFNTRFKRSGPLWESRFKRKHCATDEQLLHLTRYIHLNPVTAFLVDHPSQWEFSSYGEYVNSRSFNARFCDFEKWIRLSPPGYQNFTEDRIAAQRDLAILKDLIEND
ncbi:MAG: transposase [Candidatus Omnitrophota bacterium]